ncbi:killer cell lectin-like receptor subfamily B member 1A [Lissotriton helveticus]
MVTDGGDADNNNNLLLLLKCLHQDLSVKVQYVMPTIKSTRGVMQDYLESKLTYTAWIGLFITTASRGWTWVNGSSLNDNVFRVFGPAYGYRCGRVISGSIESSLCFHSFYWICQKDAETSCSRV